ncbi:MAG TPA: RNA ligase family protein [Pseudobdellovibrionaceae bacterium]|jgi:RNA ligase (TIGR02306 family)
MAFFGITVEKIGRIWPHSKADKMELAACEGLGFQFCVGKGLYTVGQEVLYFPTDTILPEEFKEKIGIRAPGRIKTVQLRGEYSQGFVFPLDKAKEIFNVDFNVKSPSEITLFFKATKYEPPQKFSTVGELVPLPDGQGIYDIENVDRYLDVYNELLLKSCYITEKLEGTNISISRKEGNIFVCQRANAIIEKPESPNAYWEAARNSGLIEKLQKITDQDIVLMGELIGPSIQNNIYKVDKPTIILFDIRIARRWLSPPEFYRICNEQNIAAAPILAKGVLKDILAAKTLDEYANGFSQLFNTLREGVVIRPEVEEYDHKLGRVILKKHSLSYKTQEL